MTGGSDLTSRLSLFRALAVGGALVGVLPMGCRRSSPAPSSTADVPLVVEAVGCAAVATREGTPVCEVADTKPIRVAVARSAKIVRVRTMDDAGSTLAVVDADPAAANAALHEVVVPPLASTIEVEAMVMGSAARGAIRVARSQRPAWLDEASDVWTKGDAPRASQLVQAHTNDPATLSRALATGFLARIALGQGRSDEAFPLLREAIRLHREMGRASDAADDAFALAFGLHQRSQRYTEARQVLDAVGADITHYPEGRARAAYYSGTLAGETGDHRRALNLLRQAEAEARWLGMTRLERNARSALALEMQEIGRARASLDVLQALDAELEEASRSARPGGPERSKEPPTACERVEVANNLGWGALLANEAALAAGEPFPANARAPLERALTAGCEDAYVRASAHANLARLALGEGDLDTAKHQLKAARAMVTEPRGTERIAWLELEARIDFAQKQWPVALGRIDEALGLARASRLKREEWSLLVTRGEILESQNKTAQAIEALKAAEDVLDEATLLVPLGEGRGGFATGHSRSARALLGLLVKAGRREEAVRAGRRAHSRVLVAVERALRLQQLAPSRRAAWEDSVRAYRAARAAIDLAAADDWKLPVDALARASKMRAEKQRDLRTALEASLAALGDATEPWRGDLRPTAPSSLLLEIYSDLRGFIVFASDASGTTAHRIDGLHQLGSGIARALFEPIDQKIAAATHLSVRAWGGWRTIDIHALSWRGAPLIQHASVDYSIGLDGPAAHVRSDEPQRHAAVIIGDPTSDLPAAFEEARSVATALERQDPRARLLVRGEATSRAVTDALRGAGLLHYAGHGVFAGDEGWESSLPLAAGGRLTVGDVLALAPAPSIVVLSGCDTARSATLRAAGAKGVADDGEAEGLGLAQAFLISGAAVVVAPVRSVPDVLAARVTAKLYETNAPTLHVPEEWRARVGDALRAVSTDAASSDWAAFRVLVP